MLDDSDRPDLQSSVEDPARATPPTSRPSLIAVLGWLWLVYGAGMVIQAWIGLELRDWLISFATTPAGGGPLVRNVEPMPPFTLAAFAGFGLLTIGVAIGFLRRRAWGRLGLLLVSLLVLITLVTIGVLILVLDPSASTKLFIAVAFLALGPVAFVGLLFILVAFTVSGHLPLTWDMAALGWASLGLAIWPAVSAFLLSTKKTQDAMLCLGRP